MSRTISELSDGQIIYLDENEVHTPYIYLGLDENGNARLLRQYVVTTKRMHSSNVASYSGCEMDQYLEDEETGFLSRFDAATIDALQNTSILYADYNQSSDGTVQYLTIARRCFLLSYSELGFGGTAEGKSYLAALKTATGLTGDSAARIAYSTNGIAQGWWQRSAHSASQFRFVTSNGSSYSGNATNSNYCFRPALSVAPATPVSEQGEETVFLLPDGRRTYWEIDATYILGSTTRRPKTARVLLEESGVSESEKMVSNNAKDSNPIWYAVDSNGVADLLNDIKETTNWELGVKVYAKGATKDTKIYQPVLIVETEASDGNS